jgi:hypothetical protein
MRLSRWFMLIAVLVAIGAMQVGQRNAVVLQAYALRERVDRVHVETTDVSWLSAEVDGLASPESLSRIATERELKFVAWATLDPEPAVPVGVPGSETPGAILQLAAHGDLSE